LIKETTVKRFWKRRDRLLDALVIGLAVPTIAIAATMTSQEYSQAKERAATDYKAAIARCDSLSGNPKDVCKAEAKALEVKAKAEAEAAYKNTDKARRDARLEIAEADYAVAKAKCGALAGNTKDVCVKEAKAAEIKAKADAKATEKIAAARQDAAEHKAKATETKAKADAKATEKIAAARQDATADKRDADYKVALEKCDALAGEAKDSCVANAKAKFGK
jgi:hypothetical protein